MRKIPKKNYFILFVVLGITVVLVLYARSWYNTSKDYYLQNSVIKDVAGELNYNELDSYVSENQRFILYISSGHDSQVKEFESKFKDLVIGLNIQDFIIYINSDDVDMMEFNNNLRSKYVLNSKISNQISDKALSSIYFWENGKVSFIINNPEEYTIKYIENLLKDWKLKND